MRKMFLYGVGILSASLLMPATLVPPRAQADDRAIGQFVHAGWSSKDGIPGVYALAQTIDGFLWLGTQQGLYRFDGVSFELYEPVSGPAFPSSKVTALLALPNGDLWIGFPHKSASRLRQGRNTNYIISEELPSGTITKLAQGREGAIWAATTGGLARFENDRWERIGEAWGYPDGRAVTVYVDRRGAVWVATERTVLFLPPGARKFQATGIVIGQTYQFAESPGGTLWMAETTRSVHPVNSLKPEIRVGSVDILFDDDGSLWITSIGDGMRRVPFPERPQGGKVGEFSDSAESFTAKDGLTGDYVHCILKDREGNVWVGTSAGLDRFRRGALIPVLLPAKFARKTLVAGDNGDIWVGGSSAALARIHDNTWKNMPRSFAMVYGFRDSRGAVWFLDSFQGPAGTPYYDVLRLDGDKSKVVAEMPDTLRNFGLGAVLAADGAGTLWLGDGPRGLFFLKNGRWEPFATPPEAAGKRLQVSFTDAGGRIWLGSAENMIVLIDGAHVRTLSAQQGLQVGSVQAISGAPGRVWIGGESGLAFWRDDRFHAVNPTDGDTFHGVSGVQEDSSGDVLLSDQSGVVLIPASEVSKVLQDPSRRVQYRLFDVRDGLPGTVQVAAVFPTAVHGTDGRVWFSTSTGVVRIDPARIAKNPLAPPVVIRSITANGKRYASPAGLRLPAHTRDLTIDYTALSLAIPERVRFRYKLEGSDTGWQDAGARRQAFYTNLSPGAYRFQVTASNNDGVWNEMGASWSFRIAPTFYEMRWFQALMALAGIGLIGLVYRLRLQQITARADLRYTERLEERTRIARELHDTMLQSFQASLAQMQAARNLLSRSSELAVGTLDGAITMAAGAIAEGRKAVGDLRSPTSIRHDLTDALKALGVELAVGGSATFQVVVEGPPRDLQPIIQDEIQRIGSEALRNAFLHARAHRIEADVRYSEQRLRLQIRDDGVGITPEILEAGRSNHYGLGGMRERARRIGAKLEIWSATGTGTEIDLTIPAARAYRTSSPRFRWRFFTRGQE